MPVAPFDTPDVARQDEHLRDYFRELYPPNPARVSELREEAAASLEEQRTVEERDALPFAEFVARYTAGSLV